MVTLAKDESANAIECQRDFEMAMLCGVEEVIEDEGPDAIVCQCNFETIIRCETEELLAG